VHGLLYVVIVLHNSIHIHIISVNRNGIRGRNFDVAFPSKCYRMFRLWTNKTSLGLIDPYTKKETVQLDTNIPLNLS
jgi:hypothetical protein